MERQTLGNLSLTLGLVPFRTEDWGVIGFEIWR